MKTPFKKIYNPRQLEFTPSLGNLIFYNESDIFPNEILNEKEKKLASILTEEEKYKHFLKHKGRRPNYDIYACFQPFNESFKAVFPFLKALQKTVKSGDIILSLWDRSGWHTNLLVGLFPEQHIIVDACHAKGVVPSFVSYRNCLPLSRSFIFKLSLPNLR